MNKISFNLKQQAAVLEAAKKIIIKTPKRMNSGYWGSAKLKAAKKVLNTAPGGISSIQKKEILTKFTNKVVSPKGGTNKYFKKDELAEKLIKTPKDKKGMEAIVKGHELAETNVKRVQPEFKNFFGHNAASVMLKEHNMLTTLPREQKNLKKYKILNRKYSGEADFLEESMKNFKYGKSPRFSRHAIKNLENILKQKLVNI